MDRRLFSSKKIVPAGVEMPIRLDRMHIKKSRGLSSRLFFGAKRKGDAFPATFEPFDYPSSEKGPSRRKAPARSSC
jgi:hypothetical protein